MIRDTDNDLLPDGYEVDHSLNPLLPDADSDADGDGFSNYQEFINGTDPNQYMLDLSAGWNLISLADPPDINSVSSVFGNNIIGTTWYFHDGSIVKTDASYSLESSKG